MEVIDLIGSRRVVHGKSDVRRLKASDNVPGVAYGKTKDRATISLQLTRAELRKKVKFPIRRNQLYKLQVDQDEMLVFLQDWQLNPMKTQCWEHIDFLAINEKEKVKVLVPLNFVGKCVGVTNGGILQPVRREVLISALPMDIPDSVDVDVTSLDVGRSIHVNDIPSPEKCAIEASTNYAVVAVVAPEEEVVAAPTPEEVAAEPIVTTAKKPAEEGEVSADEKKVEAKAEKGKAEKK